MNRDEILAIARECGAIDRTMGCGDQTEVIICIGEMLAFASRIESLVRERAALECEQRGNMHKDLTPESLEAFECAAAIRKSEG
jgi:hypothetical protein